MIRSALLAAFVLVPLTSGCVAVAAAGVVGVGVGVIQYNRNEVEQDFPNDLSEAWKGTFEGLARIGIVPVECVLGPTEGRIDHEDMVVLVERHPEGFTRVRVRVGTFHTGDHMRRAQILLQEIAATLERQDELRAWAQKSQPPPQAAVPEPENSEQAEQKP
jgi:hypothetical protein